jgi:hypothetical protein
MKKDKKEIEISIEQIPVEGNLGLMALGDVGIRAWREAKKRNKAESNQNDQSKK